MSDSLSAAKERIRREALGRRDAMPETRRIAAALAVADRVAELDAPPGSTVSAYWPIRSELDPRPLLFALHERGCGMALPAVTARGMVFRELTRTGDLEPAGFGTVAPPDGTPELVPDLILLPLAAFDARGNRLGYGRGHYDGAIAALRVAGHAPRLVGLAFTLQRTGPIPAEAHDVPLDAILTEAGLRPGAASA